MPTNVISVSRVATSVSLRFGSEFAVVDDCDGWDAVDCDPLRGCDDDCDGCDAFDCDPLRGCDDDCDGCDAVGCDPLRGCDDDCDDDCDDCCVDCHDLGTALALFRVVASAGAGAVKE